MVTSHKDVQGKKLNLKLPIKTVLILSCVILIEALVIGGLFLLAGPPELANAGIAFDDKIADANKPVEVLIIAEKFQNTRSGKAFLYDTEIFVVIRQKHSDQVSNQLVSRIAQISTDIHTVFRRSTPTHLHEPTLTTLTREVNAVLDEHFSRDENGKSVIERVLIRKCNEFVVGT